MHKNPVNALQQRCNNLAALQPESGSLKATLVLLLSKGGQFVISQFSTNLRAERQMLTFSVVRINNVHSFSFESFSN